MAVQKTFRDIKSLKIQGAEAVARSAIKALKDFTLKNRSKTKAIFSQDIKKATKLLISARPTEPYLRNAIAYSLGQAKSKDVREYREEVLSGLQKTLKHMQKSKKIISEIGERKIMNGDNVFTHCHSSSVMGILHEAKKDKKKFVVYNTEARPKFQGRITAKELSKSGITVNHFPDSAARIAIKQADVAFFGCDAITPTHVINKIGSELFAETCERFDVPLYIVTNSWKVDPKTVYGHPEPMEERDYHEVWKNKPKGVKIHNPAFEKIDARLITGIISELGVFKHQNFIEEVTKEYPWLFI